MKKIKSASQKKKKNFKKFYTFDLKNALIFEIENTVATRKSKRRIKSHGVGIPNVKERLEVYFPDKYELDIDASDGFYKVGLKLWLQQSRHSETSSE